MPVLEGGLTAPTLPELIAVTCPECAGAKFHEYVTQLGVDHSRRCETCFGAGDIEVCGGCRQFPEVVGGFEVCACSPCSDSTGQCEICEQPGQLDNANVCQGCRDEMAETMRREAEEHAAFVAEQLEFGRSVNWL